MGKKRLKLCLLTPAPIKLRQMRLRLHSCREELIAAIKTRKGKKKTAANALICTLAAEGKKNKKNYIYKKKTALSTVYYHFSLPVLQSLRKSLKMEELKHQE